MWEADFKSFLKVHCSEMFLVSGYGARFLSVAARRCVASHCCHRCLGGQSTKLAILRTHSETIKPKIHLLRKLNEFLTRWSVPVHAPSVALLLSVLKLAETALLHHQPLQQHRCKQTRIAQ